MYMYMYVCTCRGRIEYDVHVCLVSFYVGKNSVDRFFFAILIIVQPSPVIILL